MKYIKALLLVLTVLLILNCGKGKQPPIQEDDTPQNQSGSQSISQTGTQNTGQTTTQETNPPVQLSPEDRKIVLSISEKGYNNHDFKEFLTTRHGNIPVTKQNHRLLSRIFDTFIDHCLISYIMDKEGVKIGEAEAKQYLKKINTNFDSNITASARASAKAQRYLYLKLYKDIKVSEKEIRNYYNANKKNFQRKKEVLLHQILIKDRDQAYGIRRELIKTPHKFADIARAKSAAMDSERNNGGQMGFFEKGTLPSSMEDVVFALKANTISPVHKSAYGFHIFKVTKVRNARTLYLKNIRDQIKNTLLSDKLRLAYQAFLYKTKQRFHVKISQEALYFNYQPIPIKGEGNE